MLTARVGFSIGRTIPEQRTIACPVELSTRLFNAQTLEDTGSNSRILQQRLMIMIVWHFLASSSRSEKKSKFNFWLAHGGAH